MSEDLRAENDALRAILASSPSIPCIYCGAETMAKCPRGFPGCGQADDLLVSGDEHMARSIRAQRAHIGDLEECREDLRMDLAAAVSRAEEAEAQVADLQLKERALTDYFADASRRAETAERHAAERSDVIESFADKLHAAEARSATLEEALREIAGLFDGPLPDDGLETDAEVFGWAEDFREAHRIARAALAPQAAPEAGQE